MHRSLFSGHKDIGGLGEPTIFTKPGHHIPIHIHRFGHGWPGF